MDSTPTLSIIIPAYNERHTVLPLLKAIESVPLNGLAKEIIVIDDCSQDGTREILTTLKGAHYKVIFHEKNRGKGSAVRTGLGAATGDYILIQDADLEYDPHDYPRLLEPILEHKADVVYGSRFMADRPRRVVLFWHMVGNRLVTLISNMLTNLDLTDMATCYKVFTRQAMDKILPRLTSQRFNIEAELTALVAKERLAVYEVGVSYVGRTYEQGKKIRLKDGFSFVLAIIRFNLFMQGR